MQTLNVTARGAAISRRPPHMEPTHERSLAPSVVGAVLMTGGVAALTAVSPRTALAQTVGDLTILTAVVLAFLACLSAARSGGPAGRGWALLTVSAGLWTVGQAVWTWYGLARGHVYPFPSAADAGYLGYSLPAAAGLLLFPRAARRRFSGARAVLDALVVASSLLFISWSSVLGPLFTAGGSGLTRAVSLAYPLVDVVVASLVLTLGMRAPAGMRRPWLLLGAGLLLLTVTDSVYVALIAAGQTATTGTPLAAGWVGAFLFLALAARTSARPQVESPGHRPRHFTVLQELLPIVPALAAIVFAARHRFTDGDTVLITVGVLALLALTAQQVLDALDKVRLANGLEETVEARTVQLLGAQDRFGALVNSSDEAIYSHSAGGVLTSWNPAAQRLYGWSEREILGRPMSLLVPPELRGQEQELRERVVRGEPGGSYEAERLRKDGSRVLVALTISPIGRDVAGNGLSALAHDITDRKRHESELAQARNRALAGSRAKSEFLATMSHEIRTPMNGVIGLTGLLLDTPLDDVQRRYANGVRGAGQALLAIIDDILDFSKLEAGRVELEDAPFDPRELVEEVGVLLATTAAGKHLEFIAACSPELPALLRGDAGRLRQILINLASNAVKFTATGEVVLRARLLANVQGVAQVEFSVTDTGIGIVAADRERLFEPFSQADASTTRRFGGTGLGLAICRRLVTAMDGELSLDSQLGRGSTFRFCVPLADGAQLSQPDLRPVALDGLRVLVVDDNATNRLILTDQLTAWDLRVDTAADAEAGWLLLQQAAEQDRPYDLAVLDLCMPEVDGLTLAARLAAAPELSRTRTMILTSGGPVERARLDAAQVQVCVSKPVRSSDLHDALMRLVSTGPAGTGPYPASTGSRSVAAAGPPRATLARVLVVEDNEVNQLVAEGVLRSLGYDVDLAADGRQALDALAATRYAAVLMDCHMPEMDGYQATAELRCREGTERRTPVIAMTAGVLAEDQARCTEAGMDDFVGKPIDVALLTRTLARWVESDVEPAEPATAVLDRDRLDVLRALGPADGWGILPAVIEAFLTNAPDQAAALHRAQQRGDPAELAAVLHGLRGAATNLGADGLAERCERMESLLRTGAAAGSTDVSHVEHQLNAACASLADLLPAPS